MRLPLNLRKHDSRVFTSDVQHFGLAIAVLGIPSSCVPQNTGISQVFYNILTALAPLI